MNKWFKIGIASFAALAAMTVAAYNYVHSPKYTLSKIYSSIEQHDWQTFTKYVDVDSLANSVLEEANSSSENDFAKGLSTLASSNIKEAIISKLKYSIENPKSPDSPKVLNDLLSLDTSNLNITVEEKGKVLIASIHSKFGLYDVPAKLGITMRTDGLRYVVIGVDNSEIKSRQEIVESMYKAYYLAPIEKKINESVKISFTKKSKGCAKFIYSTCTEDLIMIGSKIENLTNREIAEVTYKMYPAEVFIDDLNFSKPGSVENIPPNKTIVTGEDSGWKYNEYKDVDKAWMYVEDDKIIIIPKSLKFADGEELVIDDIGYIINYDKLPNLKVLAEWGKKNYIKNALLLSDWIK